VGSLETRLAPRESATFPSILPGGQKKVPHSGRVRLFRILGVSIWFLHLFKIANGYGADWREPSYKAMLAMAKSTSYPAMRLAARARCEFYLLRAMPVASM
jgi:hypothetical protein